MSNDNPEGATAMKVGFAALTATFLETKELQLAAAGLLVAAGLALVELGATEREAIQQVMNAYRIVSSNSPGKRHDLIVQAMQTAHEAVHGVDAPKTKAEPS